MESPKYLSISAANLGQKDDDDKSVNEGKDGLLVNDENFRQVEDNFSEIVEGNESGKMANSRQWLVEYGASFDQSPFTGGSSEQRRLANLI